MSLDQSNKETIFHIFDIPEKFDESANYSKRNESHKKKKKQLQDPNTPCYVHKLSVEVVAHIFSHLDPRTLNTVSGVCHYWRHIVNDDVCWRDAFFSYFGSLPYRRLSLESWKTEYVLRTHIIRAWTKNRGEILSFFPTIGSLESIHVDFEDSSMFMASTEFGIAARCNVTTGKVERRLLYSTRDATHINVTATYVDSDRIVWGFPSGYVSLLIKTKTLTNGASQFKVFSGFHHGPVRVIALSSDIPNVVISGADDGLIKIWDVSNTSCAWTLSVPNFGNPTALKVTKDQRVIAGYSDGSVIIWKIDIGQILQLNRNRNHRDYFDNCRDIENELNQNRILISFRNSSNSATPVQSLLYDEEKNMVIVAYTGHNEIRKYNVDSGKCTTVYSNGHNSGASITCMRWDTSHRKITSFEKIMNPNSITKRKGNIINLSSPRSSGQNTPLSFESTKSKRLLVTGDNFGDICLWVGNNKEQDGGKISPMKVLRDGHMAAISSIYVDSCKLVTGSDDGWIRIWDPLSGANIHTIGNKIPRNAAVDRSDVDLMRVKNIWCNDYQGVATIGHQVKIWNFSPNKQLSNRRQLKTKGKASNGNIRDKNRYDIDREMNESIHKLETEKVERQQHEQNVNKLTMKGLSDEEMLHYALMLSQDSSPNSDIPLSESHIEYADDDDDLVKAVIASLNTNNDENIHDIKDGESSGSKNEHDKILEAKDIATNNSQDPEELDEELRLVLELSKMDK